MLRPFQNQRGTTRSLLTQGAKSVAKASLVATLVMGVSLPVFADSHGGAYGEIQFAKSQYMVNEDDGSVTVWVNRVGGHRGLATVEYGTAGGNAKADVDYKSTSGQLTWADGDDEPKSFEVMIHNDEEEEKLETFNVMLRDAMGNVGTMGDSMGNPSSVSLGKRITAKVKIKDDDKYTNPPPAPAPMKNLTKVTFKVTITQTKNTFVNGQTKIERFRITFTSIWRYTPRSGAQNEVLEFLSNFGEGLEEFGIEEYEVEFIPLDEEDSVQIQLLIPDDDYLSWLSALPGEPTVTDETDTGIFVDETTGIAYLVYDNEDGSKLRQDLYPVLAPTIVEGLMEQFPETTFPTLEQSANGLAFTLNGQTYYFKTIYTVLVKGFDADGFSMTEIDGGLELCNRGVCQPVYEVVQ